MTITTEPLQRWQVDTASDPSEFVRYLERLSEHQIMRQPSRERLMAAQLQPGSTVLDLGCGIGSDTLMLAEAVGPSGEVHAVDRARLMIETTACRAAQRGLKIVCKEADGAALPYPDKMFDLVWVERVLLHVPSPQDVMTEVRRVLRDGGQFIVNEPDFDGVMILDCGDADLARGVEHRYRAGVNNSRMGRALEAHALAAGFSAIRTEPQLLSTSDFEFVSSAGRWPKMLQLLIADGEISEERAEAWLQAIRAEAMAGRLIAWMPIFALFARR